MIYGITVSSTQAHILPLALQLQQAEEKIGATSDHSEFAGLICSWTPDKFAIVIDITMEIREHHLFTRR